MSHHFKSDISQLIQIDACKFQAIAAPRNYYNVQVTIDTGIKMKRIKIEFKVLDRKFYWETQSIPNGGTSVYTFPRVVNEKQLSSGKVVIEGVITAL